MKKVWSPLLSWMGSYFLWRMVSFPFSFIAGCLWHCHAPPGLHMASSEYSLHSVKVFVVFVLSVFSWEHASLELSF